jgi:hypothetical protein
MHNDYFAYSEIRDVKLSIPYTHSLENMGAKISDRQNLLENDFVKFCIEASSVLRQSRMNNSYEF